jgi:hypothetical protein
LHFRFSDKRKTALATSLLILTLALSSFLMLAPTAKAQPALLDPSDIPKFTNQLTGQPPAYTPKWMKNPNGTGVVMYYEVTMSKSAQQVLPTVDENGFSTVMEKRRSRLTEDKRVTL